MTRTAFALSLAALIAGAAQAGPPKPEPLRLVNAASFTASCTLLISGSGLADPVRLSPGETYAHRIPAKREVRLVCLNGKTRDKVLTPGATYRLVEVNHHLELAEEPR